MNRSVKYISLNSANVIIVEYSKNFNYLYLFWNTLCVHLLNIKYFNISDDVKTLIESSSFIPDDKSKAIFAVSYLESVEDTKGSMAFELANKLTNNYDLDEGSLKFNLHLYIKNAISWVCEGVYNELQ